MNYKEINDENVQAVLNEVLGIINKASMKQGVKITPINYPSSDPRSLEIRMLIQLADKDDKYETPEERNWRLYHEQYGLKDSLLHAIIQVIEGKILYHYEILGIGVGRKYPVAVKCIEDGGVYNFEPSKVLSSKLTHADPVVIKKNYDDSVNEFIASEDKRKGITHE